MATPVSAQGVKIGVLNDQSRVYADNGSKYSHDGARIVVEDSSGEVLGRGQQHAGMGFVLFDGFHLKTFTVNGGLLLRSIVAQKAGGNGLLVVIRRP